MTAVEIAARRLRIEEGVRRRAYNDATGETVSCLPGGRLTIGVGINLETGLDDEEVDWLLRHRLGLVETALLPRPFYQGLDAPRASVLLDIGYNAGVPGLLKFSQMLTAVEGRNWPRAQSELLDSRAARMLTKRYAALALILLTGNY